MPLYVTLAEFRPLVRSQGAVQRVRFVDDADLNPWIVGAWVRLYDLYSFDTGDPYFEREALRTVETDEKLAVPSDLYALRRVDYMSGSEAVELPDLDVHEVASQGQWPCDGLRGYRYRAQELQLPHARSGQKIRLTYIPVPVEPKDGTGTYLDTGKMDVVTLKGREYVVLMASVRVLQKQREDTSSLLGEARDLRAEILSTAKRSKTRLKRVSDTASVQFEDPYLSRRGFAWRR